MSGSVHMVLYFRLESRLELTTCKQINWIVFIHFIMIQSKVESKLNPRLEVYYLIEIGIRVTAFTRTRVLIWISACVKG